MPDIPECLERRYQALDSLIEELSARRLARESDASCSKQNENAAIKLMCEFWDILKDDPDCNLKKEVEERMGLQGPSPKHSSFGPHRVTCYMSDRMDKNENDRKKEALENVRDGCCKQSQESKPRQKEGCCSSRSLSKNNSDVLPLSKVLCSLKDAASFDKKCNERVSDLMAAQKRLQEQIQHLEHREKEGTKLLKQADCMWACMEESYKKKVAESLDRQKKLMKDLKLAEAEVAKWRKSKKELEFQLNNVNKCKQEITENTHQKKNDIKNMKTEIADFKKRIENGAKDKDAAHKSLSTKKQASDKIVAGINNEIMNAQKTLSEEKNHKYQKELEGNNYIKEAREDLQKICRVLLQKKLENEDLKAEKEALLLEIEMLRQTCDQCQDKCKKKQVNINDEILKVEKEIANFKVRCIRCHECVDTSDVRKFCTDCPRCLEERDCIIEGEQCSADPTNVCVCMSVKQKFMDNVFENMYTVLERQVKTCQGKSLAETVMQCLRKSRNGKIDDETRKILQEFILTVVKKNLNLTIIGGAVKTRCEDPCTRWGGASECNCPGGPKVCVCTKKAPPPPKDPTPCPEDPEDKEDNAKREKIICPHKQNVTCGTDCAMRGVDSLVGTEVAPWTPEPCREKSCPFSKNMRAAQCVLGPERLSDLGKVRPFLSKSDFQENALGIEITQTEAVRIKNKSEASTITCKNVCQGIGTKRDLIKKEGLKLISVRSEKTTKEKDVLLKKIYETDDSKTNSCSCETTSPLATWKISIVNENGDIVDYCTELVSTSTGELGIELDDNFFHLIERKISKNPKSSEGVLVKDKAGYYTLDFNPKNISDNDLKIKIKRTPMGSMSLVVNKNFIEHIKSHGFKPDGNRSIEVLNKKNIILNKNETPAELQSKEKSKSENDIMKRLEHICAERINGITLKIVGNNGNFEYVNAKILRTPSNRIAIEVDKIKIIEENLNEENIGSLHLSHSETFLLDFTKANADKPQNILIKESSNNIQLIIKDKLMANKPHVNGLNDYFKIKVKGANNDIISPPAVLSLTKSENYLVIVDKEFERKYKETLKDITQDNILGSGKLSKTPSGHYIINLNDEDEKYCNAYLVKSFSGNIKIVVSGPAFDSIKRSSSRNDSISSAKLLELLKKHPRNHKKFNKNQNQGKFSQIRSNSESSIFNKSRIENHESFVMESGSLKKTSSGRLSVVLSKESKKTFINSLGTYIKRNSNSLIPIKRTESGGITIILNGQDNHKGQYGSLKISPSGNIYVVIDDKNKVNNTKTKLVETVSSGPVIETVQNPSNKAVSTTCQANPFDDCCNFSKCICGELQNMKSDWYTTDVVTDNVSCLVNVNKQEEGTVCKMDNCLNKRVDFDANVKENCSDKSMPHLIIKPCDDCYKRRKFNNIVNSNQRSKQCFYVIDYECPFHKDRYNTVSNELLEISGLCNKNVDLVPSLETIETQKLTEIVSWVAVDDNTTKKPEFDYLDAMPPQLPSFLRDFSIS
ncbi:uncharacterized protein LOC106137332 isoform X2 [Amyelois transitella]|uniref:uncharacterized protein LOC106137332 isoform X2 n=1 Tax=Amyelois transitella TaxID=680683 RepID=UPI00298F9963|nr:uncharacterized protein LOC106137332 isoform X2 [Amyelois transitella]